MTKLSVIISTFNEEGSIAGCISSLKNQNYQDFEIIVVDDGSTDKTLQVLRNFQFPPAKRTKFSNFQVLRQDHMGPGAARNLGAKHAKGDILVFVDADMTFEPDFIKKLVEPITKGGVKGTFSNEEYVTNWDNVWARCWNINQNWEERRRHPKDYPDRQKVFRAILKSEFEEVAGFEPGGYTDDYSLSEKLGYLATVARGAKFFHENPAGLGEIFNQAKWIGKRKYKLGKFGYLAALIRASFPVSIVLGLYKSVKFKTPEFFIFKIVYDFGVFIGILEYLLIGKSTK